MLILASTDKSSELFREVMPWLLLLLGVIIVGGAIIYVARRRINAGAAEDSGGFTLHDLREMHKAGEISDAEFTRAKAHMIGRLAATAESADHPETPPGNPSEHPQ